MLNEIATRHRRWDGDVMWGSLPDPDPVLRKLGEDMTVYRDLTSDAHVWACLQSRKSGTLAREWKVAAGDDTAVPVRRVKLCQAMLRKTDMHQTIADMLDAPFYGMSPVEVCWKSSGNHWSPKSVQAKPVEWFTFDFENNLRFVSRDNVIEGEELPPYKFLLARHFASYDNPYGERLLARCFWPVTFKRGGWRFWSVFTEKYGMPWTVGKVSRNTSDPDRAKLLANLKAMVSDAVAVVNSDESVEHPDTGAKSASADIYEKLISSANREISKAILGQTLTTEIDKGGSYSASQTHMQVRSELVEQDQKMIAGQFDTLLRWYSELNFGSGAAPVFRFIEDENIQTERAVRDTELNKQGVSFTKPYYTRVYGFKDDEIEIQPAAPAAPSQAEQPPDFAEAGSASAKSVSDRITDKALDAVSDGAASLYTPVKKLLDESGDLAEFRDRLLDLYGEMDDSALAEAMEEALTLATLSGRYEAL